MKYRTIGGVQVTKIYPYISITGFTEASQVKAMLATFLRCSTPGREIHYKLGVGVMMSYKTLNGLSTKWTKVFPSKEKVAEVFLPDVDYWIFNTLHYADYEGIDILNNLLKATEFGGSNMHALQLDMVWPEPYIIEAYRKKHSNIQIILQIGIPAFEQINNDPEELVARLQNYQNNIDYVLLDKSMGRGAGMDAKFLEPFVQVINPRLSLEPVVAGGLGPDTLYLLGNLPHYLISIDAQSKLRPSGNALDPIDWEMAGKYLSKALSILL